MFVLIQLAQRRTWVLAAIAVFVFGVQWSSVLAEENRPSGDHVRTGFAHPPRTARPSAYWLWLNGYANCEYMDRELKAFAEHGIGGLCIFDMGARGDAKFFPPTGPEFMGDESVKTIAHAIKKANEYGLDALRRNVSARFSLRGLRRLIWVNTLRRGHTLVFSRDGSFMHISTLRVYYVVSDI